MLNKPKVKSIDELRKEIEFLTSWRDHWKTKGINREFVTQATERIEDLKELL